MLCHTKAGIPLINAWYCSANHVNKKMKGLIRQGGWKGRWMPIVHILGASMCDDISSSAQTFTEGPQPQSLGLFPFLGAKYFKNCDPEL